MFLRQSRYYKQAHFIKDEPASFQGIQPRAIDQASGVIEHTVAEGDRLDLLAKHYYNNDRLWWRIVDANPHIVCACDISVSSQIGQTILIPKIKE